MQGLLGNKRAQSTAEYAILIALVIGAAVAMQTYVKRSMSGGIKFAVDKLQKSDSALGQYEPYYLQSNYDAITSEYKDTVETKSGGEVVRTYGAEKGKEKTVTRSGSQTLLDTSYSDYTAPPKP